MQTLTTALLLVATVAAYSGTATHYSPAQGGTAICGQESGYCGAPTDGAPFWEGAVCGCGASDPFCTNSYCEGCCDSSLCQYGCPSCPTTMCGKRFKITCNDDGSGYCRSQGACVVMKVTNACPMYNPCNTCKNDGHCGYGNVCKAGSKHIDLCDQTFDAIAYRNKQPGGGIKIEIEATNLPEGPCGGNNGFAPRSYDDEEDHFGHYFVQ